MTPTPPPRERVVHAARKLFLDQGYAATSIGAIAREADVALQTIYSGFGSKVGVLAAVQDHSLAGDTAPIPLLERKWIDQLTGGSPSDELHTVVTHFGAATARAAPINGVIRSAASDPGVAQLLNTLHDQRIRTCQMVAKRVLRSSSSARQLADSLYALLGIESYELLVVRRGWSRRRWEEWAEGCLQTQLGK